MSNSIFPIPALPAGSRGWPIIKYPVFNTIVESPVSGRGETRISTTPYCRWDFEMTFPYVKGTFNDSTSYLNQVVGFYMQMQGAAQSWLFDDPQDNLIPNTAPATFGLGDGTTKVFQITRPIGGYADIIQNIKPGTLVVYINGSSTTAFSIDTLGVISFTSAPANGAVLAWSGGYYFRCRFEEDSLSNLAQIALNHWQIQQFKWRSIIN
jgi:uncharacterized protein (TIGR02217 family)